MRWVPISSYLVIPLLLFLAILQSSVTSHIRVLGVSPDLVLLFSISWALLEGTREGLFVSLVGGATLDALSGTPFGLSILSLLIVSYLASVGAINVFLAAKLLPYIAVALATLIYNGVFLGLLQMTGRVVIWGPTLWRVVFPAMLVNTACMPVVYNLVLWIHNRTHLQTVEWE